MPNCVFYSISSFGVADIKTGSPTISISGGVATLSVPQTGNIGAGCEIVYDTDNKKAYIAPAVLAFTSGGTYEVVPGDVITGATSGATGIIRAVELTSGTWAGGNAAGNFYLASQTGTFQGENLDVRTNSNVATSLFSSVGNMLTTFVVKTATGGFPGDIGAVTVNSIHHVWASLSDLEVNSTGASYINNTNFTAAGANVILVACCYYDHNAYAADTASVTYFGQTTDSTHYIIITTPTGGKESINNQRHAGVWDTTKYRLDVNAGFGLRVLDNYVKVSGLQINSTRASVNFGSVFVVDIVSVSGATEYSRNLLKAVLSGTTNATVGIRLNGAGNVLKCWNNISYDVINSTYTQRGIKTEGGTMCAYNNTVYNCHTGFNTSGGTTNLKNNISNAPGAGGDYSGTWNTTANNISSDATSPNVAYQNKTVSFVNAAGKNFHLASSDTNARDSWSNVYNDADVPVRNDIDGHNRPNDATGDIGADEILVVNKNRSFLYSIISSLLLTKSIPYEELSRVLAEDKIIFDSLDQRSSLRVILADYLKAMSGDGFVLYDNLKGTDLGREFPFEIRGLTLVQKNRELLFDYLRAFLSEKPVNFDYLISGISVEEVLVWDTRIAVTTIRKEAVSILEQIVSLRSYLYELGGLTLVQKNRELLFDFLTVTLNTLGEDFEILVSQQTSDSFVIEFLKGFSADRLQAIDILSSIVKVREIPFEIAGLLLIIQNKLLYFEYLSSVLGSGRITASLLVPFLTAKETTFDIRVLTAIDQTIRFIYEYLKGRSLAGEIVFEWTGGVILPSVTLHGSSLRVNILKSLNKYLYDELVTDL